jgi:ergothioneine biosynthesis protein EgtB
LLSRPTVAEIKQYRHSVDQLVCGLLEDPKAMDSSRFAEVMELGIQHEQQHQELMLTDIKHVFSCNPLLPAYCPGSPSDSSKKNSDGGLTDDFTSVPGARGLVSVGDATDHFVFDNERPRHQVYLQPFRLHTRLITNAQYLQFIKDGGYQRPELWLSLGWQAVQLESWRAPLYWFEVDGTWRYFTLSGAKPIDLSQPVCHVSFFEADAYARWRGCRLPLEAEWEVIAAEQPIAGNFVESGFYQPTAFGRGAQVQQLFGDVWEWTASPYVPYPGYAPAAGALGEYNGKFMCNQFVLRGGSCVSSVSHLRATYRNFFPPDARWQFTGIRLAEDDA